MIINCEGDEIAYRCSFACQKQGYKLTTRGRVVDLKNRYTKTQIKAQLGSKGKILDRHYTLEAYPILEPEHIVIHTLDAMVSKLFDITDDRIDCIHDVNLWLSPSDHSNFRYSVATTPGSNGPGYKAGRAAKPYYLSFIRERLIKEWGAKEIKGYEADDALGIYQTKDTIASHIDKDINMIPGLHYNHVTQEVYEVPEGLGTLEYTEGKLKGRGLMFFYAQMLTGDATDNIPGIKGIGAKGAYERLIDCKEEKECFDMVAGCYLKQYTEAQYKDILAEVADLLWIVQNEGETGRCYLQNKGLI